MPYVFVDEQPKDKYIFLDEADAKQPTYDASKPASVTRDGKTYTADHRSFGDMLKEELNDNPWSAKYAAAGTALSDLYIGGKQLLGYGDQKEADANRIIREENPGSALAGNLALFYAGGAAAPVLNTTKGVAATGGTLGMLNPDAGEGLNTNRIGHAMLGVGGAMIGQKIGNAISNSIVGKVANNAMTKAQNTTRDATIGVAKKIGYSLPRSLYNPSLKTNTLEAYGGKAATLQQASSQNQKITNNLARKSLDLPEDAPLSMGTIEKVRQGAYKTYQEVASLSKEAKNTLEQLKLARVDANAWFKSYNVSNHPEHLEKAKGFREIADMAESTLEGYARQAGRGSLVNELKQARKMIAKTYTLERAMNNATGDIDARVLARMFEKGSPLSDGLDDIGRFASAFPKAAQPIQHSAGAGISALDAVLATGVGVGGVCGSDSPLGAAYGVLPMLMRPAARGVALSKFMQKAPTYGGSLLNMANKTSPLLPYMGGRVGGLLGSRYE